MDVDHDGITILIIGTRDATIVVATLTTLIMIEDIGGSTRTGILIGIVTGAATTATFDVTKPGIGAAASTRALSCTVLDADRLKCPQDVTRCNYEAVWYRLLYQVPTHRLNEQVKRNRKRFPSDFMFRLSKEEAESVRSQIAISNSGRAGRRTLPYAFTEQGVAMLSGVLNSKHAIDVNIAIMRAFVKLRQMLETNETLNRKFAAVIRKLSTHDKYFTVIFDKLKRMSEPSTPSRKQIGFKAKD